MDKVLAGADSSSAADNEPRRRSFAANSILIPGDNKGETTGTKKTRRLSTFGFSLASGFDLQALISDTS